MPTDPTKHFIVRDTTKFLIIMLLYSHLQVFSFGLDNIKFSTELRVHRTGHEFFSTILPCYCSFCE